MVDKLELDFYEIACLLDECKCKEEEEESDD